MFTPGLQVLPIFFEFLSIFCLIRTLTAEKGAGILFQQTQESERWREVVISCYVALFSHRHEHPHFNVEEMLNVVEQGGDAGEGWVEYLMIL